MTKITREIIEDLMENACSHQSKCFEKREEIDQFHKEKEKSGENTLCMFIDGLIDFLPQPVVL